MYLDMVIETSREFVAQPWIFLTHGIVVSEEVEQITKADRNACHALRI